MRRGIVIVGIVLLVIGLLLIAGAYVVQSMGTTQSVPAGSAWELSPSTIGAASVSISWSGAGSGGSVYLTSGTPACSSPGGVVAQGSGDSGSFTATLSPGTTYSLYACSGGSFASASFTYTATGLSVLLILGIVLFLVGAVVTLLGMRARSRMTEPEPAAMEPPPA